MSHFLPLLKFGARTRHQNIQFGCIFTKMYFRLFRQRHLKPQYSCTLVLFGLNLCFNSSLKMLSPIKLVAPKTIVWYSFRILHHFPVTMAVTPLPVDSELGSTCRVWMQLSSLHQKLHFASNI